MAANTSQLIIHQKDIILTPWGLQGITCQDMGTKATHTFPNVTVHSWSINMAPLHKKDVQGLERCLGIKDAYCSFRGPESG